MPPKAARELRMRSARRDITERRRITQRLRQALGLGGFMLHYQPIVTLATGKARGAEALIRLSHPRRGLVPGQLFMHVAEQSDVVIDIAAWMLRTACADATSWPAHATVGLALSPRHMRSGQLVLQLLEAVGKTGLAPERLEFELTEAMLLDASADATFALKALQGLGARLALNRFGTGYASLSALERLSFTTLRLDRSLIQAHGAAMLHAVVEAGHALGCTVLADGVESEAQFLQLQEIGADEGQGPYFGPPVEAGLMKELFHPGF